MDNWDISALFLALFLGFGYVYSTLGSIEKNIKQGGVAQKVNVALAGAVERAREALPRDETLWLASYRDTMKIYPTK